MNPTIETQKSETSVIFDSLLSRKRERKIERFAENLIKFDDTGSTLFPIKTRRPRILINSRI